MRRQGFTLVEMLVSLALVLFVMVLLSQALSTGLETFRQLKSTGELTEKLQMAATILRQDLKLDHFEGKRRLSDPAFWMQGPPREGFFHIEQGPTILEGRDGDGIPSFKATSHSLHFSIKLRGNRRDDFLAADLPIKINGVTVPPSTLPSANSTFFNFPPDSRYQESPNSYSSQWAEVAYFLVPNGALAGGSSQSPLFSLYRRQRLAVPDNTALNWGHAAIRVANANEGRLRFAQHSGISCGKADPTPNKYPNQLYFNSPTDLTVPERRFGMNHLPGSGGFPSKYRPLGAGDEDFPPAGMGEDLLLTDVVSFAVRVLSPDMLNQPATPPTRPYDHVDDPSDGPNSFVSLPANPRFGGLGVFDTWSTVQDDVYNYSPDLSSVPLPIRIRALQITVRVYDMKTQQTRQITIVQDM